MDFLRQWAVSVCVCGIVATIFSVLSPKGKMERLLKLVISVFILTSLVTPFLGMSKSDFKESFDFSVSDIDEAEIQKQTNDLSQKSMDIQLASQIEDFLNQRGFDGSSVKVISSINENNEYTIDGIEVEIQEKFENSLSTISSILYDHYSYDMNVKVIENNE